MDQNLAQLIQDNGVSIWPYLVLRSEYILNGPIKKEKAEALTSDSALDILRDSEYISIDSDDLVQLKSGGRWLCDAPEQLKREQPKESNFDMQLERIAQIAGYPIDFEHKKGKYRALYSTLQKKYGFDAIESIAYINRGCGLEKLLTPAWFRSLQAKFEEECH